MSYPNRRFGHCVVPWTIDVCCTSPFLHERMVIESPVLNIATRDTLTRWRMTLKYRRSRHRSTVVQFELQRLHHEGFLRNRVSGEYSVALKVGEAEKLLGYDFFTLLPWESIYFNVTMELPLPSNVIELTLKIVYYFDDFSESLPECSDPSIKQLSRDMRELYTYENNGYDIMFRAGPFFTLYLHKKILLQRLKREDIKREIRERDIVELGLSTRDGLDRSLSFLYTADMNTSTYKPTISVYDTAVLYGVEPVIAYYEPDHVHLYTRTDYEELAFTWTVVDLPSRQHLVSRRTIGETYNGIMRLTKCIEGRVNIHFKITLETAGYVCLELFVQKAETLETSVAKSHQETRGSGETIGISADITNMMIDVPKGGSVTFKLLVKLSGISSNPDELRRVKYKIVGKSRVVRKPFCHEQNFMQLSDDLMALYRSSKYFSVNVGSPIAMYNNEDDDYILRFRNEHLADRLLSADGVYQEEFPPSVLRALVQFMYCAELGDLDDIEDSFRLIDIANECRFDSLQDALTDNLKNLLSDENAYQIYTQAESRKIAELVAYIQSQNYSSLEAA